MLSQSDLFWDEIVSIEYIGEENTYDLTIEDNHNFVANGLIVHNSHACGYAILSYWTAFLRYYYPAEWLASVIQVDSQGNDAEDKLTINKKACDNAGIEIINANVNDSGLETIVTKKGKIALPLTSIKGVGANSKPVIINQPFEDMRDFVFRAKPNRGIVSALAENKALDCFSEVKGKDLEYIMEYFDDLADDRKKMEKQVEREAKMTYKTVSPFRKKNNEMNDNVIMKPDKKKSAPSLEIKNMDKIKD
jgi:DNA polymerase III alpha subunit